MLTINGKDDSITHTIKVAYGSDICDTGYYNLITGVLIIQNQEQSNQKESALTQIKAPNLQEVRAVIGKRRALLMDRFLSEGHYKTMDQTEYFNQDMLLTLLKQSFKAVLKRTPKKDR